MHVLAGDAGSAGKHRCSMAGEQDVLTKARALGQALAAHPTVRAHHDAERTINADTAAQQLLNEYEEQLRRVRQLEAERKPVEVADKQKLRELQSKLAGHESLKVYMRTQTDYAALMSQVNR